MSEPMQDHKLSEEQPPQAAPPPATPPPATAAALNDPRRRSPFLACALSLMPGLGQVYVGYYQRGFIHAIVVAVIIAFLSAAPIEPLIPLGAIFLAFFWLYNIVDAGRRAMLYNEVLAGRSGVEPPEDFPTPDLRGSLAGGIVIAAIGLLLLAHTRFDVSLEWLDEWWPAVIVAFGAYLVWKALEEKKAAESASSDLLDEG